MYHVCEVESNRDPFPRVRFRAGDSYVGQFCSLIDPIWFSNTVGEFNCHFPCFEEAIRPTFSDFPVFLSLYFHSSFGFGSDCFSCFLCEDLVVSLFLCEDIPNTLAQLVPVEVKQVVSAS
jgi:hypothetical protein